MKGDCNKTEYMCEIEREAGGTGRSRGGEVEKVHEFKYLGSSVRSSEECEEEVKR